MRTTFRRAVTALLLSLSVLALVNASAQTSLGVQGPVPVGLPNRLMVGLFEEAGQTWMRDSGIPWDVRYRYFTKGWADNWGWGAYDGAWAEYTLATATTVVPIPDDMPFEQAAIIPDAVSTSWAAITATGQPFRRARPVMTGSVMCRSRRWRAPA